VIEYAKVELKRTRKTKIAFAFLSFFSTPLIFLKKEKANFVFCVRRNGVEPMARRVTTDSERKTLLRVTTRVAREGSIALRLLFKKGSSKV